MQIAKALGAWVVTTAGSDEKVARGLELGADASINYTQLPQFSARVRELTEGDGVDIVVDHIGASVYEECVNSLRRGGSYVNCGVTAGSEVTLDIARLAATSRTMSPSWARNTSCASGCGSSTTVSSTAAAARFSRCVTRPRRTAGWSPATSLVSSCSFPRRGSLLRGDTGPDGADPPSRIGGEMKVDRARFERALNPRAVAVVGDAKVRGHRWLKGMSTVQGKVYSVQVDPNEIPEIEALGVPNYQSLVDIPDEIDFVVVAVPRNVAPIILKQCIEKEVAGAAFFTSGFAETATEEGRALQETMTQLARDSGLVLIGPNCMGLYNAAAGVRFGPTQPVGFEGAVTFVSQSGAHAGDFVQAAYEAGVRLGKAVSFGNGIVLENADYLEYFADDPKTEYLAMYVEGLQDGRRFFRLLNEATRKKPVVLWKGGRTEAGGRATASHTASLAGSTEVWDAACRQAGALQADSLAETVDVMKALTLLPPFTGDGIGITGGSGGQSVAMTDAFATAGLRVPTLSDASYAQLEEWFSLVGASFRNPIDMGSNRTEIDQIFGILRDDANIDVIVMQLRPRPEEDPDRERIDIPMEALVRSMEQSTKPHLAILYSPTPLVHAEPMREMERRLAELGMASFLSYERAARAIAKVGAYYRGRAES